MIMEFEITKSNIRTARGYHHTERASDDTPTQQISGESISYRFLSLAYSVTLVQPWGSCKESSYHMYTMRLNHTYIQQIMIMLYSAQKISEVNLPAFTIFICLMKMFPQLLD